MTTLNLASKKITEKTSKEIAEFVYNNQERLSNELKVFYQDVKCIIDVQTTKNASKRITMDQILERAYNIENRVLASGASYFKTQFI